MKTIDKNSAPHYVWGDGCDNWVLTETPGLSIKQESMPAGAREKSHFHYHVQQFFFILKGIAVFYVGEKKHIIKEHQGILIQAGAKHYIANESNETLEFLIISQPSVSTDRVNLE